MFFRIESLKKLLIGQGRAILIKQKSLREPFKTVLQRPIPNEGNTILDENYFWRLSDAVERENIYGVKQVLLYFVSIENVEIPSRPLPNGYKKHVYPKFEETERRLNTTKWFGFLIICFAALGLLIILANEQLGNRLENNSCIECLSNAAINFLPWVLILASTFYIGWTTFAKVGFEKDKAKQLKKPVG